MMKIKRQNDNKARVIMSNGDIREVKYKSELLDRIREDLIAIENESSDCDQESFTEDDVWSLYEFLLMRHKDDWVVIDDMKDDDEEVDSDTEDSYYEEEYFYEEEHTVNESIFMRRNILSMMNMKIKLTCEYEEAV